MLRAEVIDLCHDYAFEIERSCTYGFEAAGNRIDYLNERDALARLQAEYAAAIERGMLATADLQGHLAELQKEFDIQSSCVNLWRVRAEQAEAEVERLNERLSLCEVPDGWEAWRLKMRDEKTAEAILDSALALIGHPFWRGKSKHDRCRVMRLGGTPCHEPESAHRERGEGEKP
jgi:hypothetical protein